MIHFSFSLVWGCLLETLFIIAIDFNSFCAFVGVFSSKLYETFSPLCAFCNELNYINEVKFM